MANKKTVNKKDNTLYYILLLIAIVAIASLCYLLLSRPAKQECPAANCTLYSTPKRNVSEVQKFIGRVMDSYTDLAYADPTVPKFIPDEGIWEESVILNRTGSSKRVSIRVYDSNLTLQSVMVEGPAPLSVSENEVVAKGVVKMSGKLSCSQEKTRVFVFFDLYCPLCIAAESKVEELRQKFNNVSFEYKIIPTHSYDLAQKYGLSNVTRALGYLLCSRAQGKLDEFKKCAVDAYMKHEEIPLTEDELVSCVNESTLNATELDTCMSTYNIDMNKDWMLAESFSLVGALQTVPFGAPVLSVDCQYKAEPAYAEAAICYAHPELKECK